MRKLVRADLLSLEAYSEQRASWRAHARAHKRARSLRLGESFTLLFEDRLTVQAQVQEMLRIERIFAAQGIQDELDAYNPLIPDGHNLKATLLIEYPDPAERARELARLHGIEHALLAQVEGHGCARTFADEDLPRSDTGKTSAVHFLRFEFSPAQIDALRAGAVLTFRLDDARLPLATTAPPSLHELLLRDFSDATSAA